MFNHLLIFIALISFSVVSFAAATPMDAGQATVDATQNAVLHKDVAVIQGGRSDKDVAEVLSVMDTEVCSTDAQCTKAAVELKTATLNEWFIDQDNDSALQPVVVLILIIGLIVFFLSRKSSSTK